MQQVVLPIKDSNVLKEVQDTLLNNFKAGRRNYTVFQVGKATLLRVSDVMRLNRPIFLIRTVLLNKMRSFTTEKRVNLIPCTLNLFKQSSHCTVNGYLIISWILNGSFLPFNTQNAILRKNSSTKS